VIVVSPRTFDKYEGTGNDFIVLDAARWPESNLSVEGVRALCDRHTGIGGDGVLWVAPNLSTREARLIIRNADGSRPEMCGNGVRCVVAWLADRGMLKPGESVTVQSDAGPRRSTLLGGNGTTWHVEVDMGTAHVAPAEEAQAGVAPPFDVYPVDVGNPHGVVFDAVPDTMAALRAVSKLPVFPHGVNVEFVTREGEGFRVRVHERGVGWTRACGTGACAVAAAAVRKGLAPPGIPIAITLDGGTLTVVVEPHSARVRMTGPARRVFSGELPPEP
jgi:diaminopimelate epimerase